MYALDLDWSPSWKCAGSQRAPEWTLQETAATLPTQQPAPPLHATGLCLFCVIRSCIDFSLRRPPMGRPHDRSINCMSETSSIWRVSSLRNLLPMIYLYYTLSLSSPPHLQCCLRKRRSVRASTVGRYIKLAFVSKWYSMWDTATSSGCCTFSLVPC